MGRFAKVARATLKENNPKAYEKFLSEGSLDTFLAAWEEGVRDSIAIRCEALWKAGDPMAEIMAESVAMADALDSPLFRGHGDE